MSVLVIHHSSSSRDRMEARVRGRKGMTCSDAFVHISLSLLPPNVQSSPSAVGSLANKQSRQNYSTDKDVITYFSSRVI